MARVLSFRFQRPYQGLQNIGLLIWIQATKTRWLTFLISMEPTMKVPTRSFVLIVCSACQSCGGLGSVNTSKKLGRTQIIWWVASKCLRFVGDLQLWNVKRRFWDLSLSVCCQTQCHPRETAAAHFWKIQEILRFHAQTQAIQNPVTATWIWRNTIRIRSSHIKFREEHKINPSGHYQAVR